jgi:Spy/CpxP family protein refolding chaperone
MTRSSNLWLAAFALTGIAAISLADTPAPPADAPPVAHAHRHGAMMQHPFMHVLHQLNLTAEQKTQVHSILATAHPQMQALHSSSQSNMEALLKTAPTDPGYPALLETAKQNAAAHIKLMSDLHTQIYSVLSPEQKAKIPAIVDAQKAKWHAAHEGPAPAQMQ